MRKFKTWVKYVISLLLELVAISAIVQVVCKSYSVSDRLELTISLLVLFEVAAYVKPTWAQLRYRGKSS